MSNIPALQNIPELSFIDNRTIEDVRKEMLDDFTMYYKQATGEEITLGAADPSRLILQACTLQIYQCLKCIDEAGKSNFLKYAKNEILDNIAASKHITRMVALPAKTTIRFTLSSVMSRAISIPGGIRITGNDNIYFITDEYAEIQTGNTYVDVSATCVQSGEVGNNIGIGELNTLVDSVPYIDKVKNITITTGGTDEEDDDSLTERVYLAPSSYSVAGPEDAYKYHVKSYNGNITDVKVDSPNPCEVNIYFLMDGELPTQTIIDGLGEHLNSKTIRPMCDLVTVSAPQEEEYNIEFTYYIATSDTAQATSIRLAVEKAVEDYKVWQRKIGRDINPSKLISLVMKAGAKRVEVVSPVFGLIDANNVAKVATTTMNYGGLEDD